MVLVALGFIMATTLVPPLWLIARNVVTIVHEMGHAVVARLCGRRISGIKVHSDTSGLAITRGRPRGLGVLLTALAGYPAPALVGLGMVWAVTTGRAGAALLGMVVLLAAAFLLVRNLWGGLVVTASLLGAALIFWRGDSTIMTASVLGLGLFLTVGSVRAAFDLARAHLHGQAEHSDAATAQANSLIPAGLWLGFYLLVTSVAALWSLGRTLAQLL